MSDYKITKQLIKRFKQADPEVRIVNGNKKVATVPVKYSNNFEYKIEVEKIINGMEAYAFKENKPKMVYPYSTNSGIVIDVPEELNFAVDKLKDLVQTSEDEETQLKRDFENGITRYHEEMGWN